MPDAAVQTVEVALAERSYPIEIGSGNLSRVGELLAERTGASRAILITDENVAQPYAQAVSDSIAAAGAEPHTLIVPPGEPTKSVAQLDRLWREMLAAGADRKTAVVAIGGGVVGDLAGFAAASFARGLPLVQVPTTLLAQVDSSVGGKVGINLPGAKNMVGAFWQPRAVLIDTRVLATLPLREYRAGLAEVVKYGVILDADFFAYLETHRDAINARDDQALAHIVARSCQLKADVVQQDEREETGLRAVLNYGHTFCHAFETATGYGELLHGEAVAIGMQCAARLAQQMGRIDSSLVDRQQALLTAVGLSTAVPDVSADRLLELMRRDKKVAHGRLRFVLPTRLGHVELVDAVNADDVRRALAP